MEKDWNARFEMGKSQSPFTPVVAMLLLIAAIVWAFIILATGLRDSMGNPKNQDFGSRLALFTFALAPMILPVIVLYLAKKMRKR